MSKIIPGKLINEEDNKYILSLAEKDLKISTIVDLLGDFDGKKYNEFDYIKIPKGTEYGNFEFEEDCITTIGIWMFNRLFLENELSDIFGYINHPINGDDVEDIIGMISYSRLEDKIGIDALKHFLLKTQIIMKLTTVIGPHFTDELLSLSSTLEPLKTKLLKDNKDAIKNGDEVVAEDIEKQLISKTMETLSGDDSLELFQSKARGNIPNNLKNLCMMKGAVMNLATHKYEIATSNFMDGINADEYHIFANSIAPGATARAVKTQVGGYWEKLLLSAFQHVIIGPKGSDCGTKRTIKVQLNKKNIKNWMYSFIQKGDKLVEITSDNMNDLLGELPVNMRFASMCESKDYICEKCAGTLFRRLGIKNAGMVMPKLGSTLKQRSLKGFHDSTVKTTEMDPMVAFNSKGIKIA